jgi:hypothetical protein
MSKINEIHIYVKKIILQELPVIQEDAAGLSNPVLNI